MLSQRLIYDERYRGSGYDERSAVRVLQAERKALRAAFRRTAEMNADAHEITVLDFGYGTGRVTNEFAFDYLRHPEAFDPKARDLRIVAYDVSRVGLWKAAEALERDGFSAHGRRGLYCYPDPDARVAYVAGALRKSMGGVAVTVVFIHGSEFQSPNAVRRRLESVNRGRPYLLTTSWYSGLGHVPKRERRRQMFAVLGELTHGNGDLVVAVSATGDLVREQRTWARRLRRRQIDGLPIEGAGDAMYATELGQLNYWHCFGLDLIEMLAKTCTGGQQGWLQAIRFPGREFRSPDEENENFDKVNQFHEELVSRAARPGASGNLEWQAKDFRRVHTVAAIRTAHPGGYDYPEPLVPDTGAAGRGPLSLAVNLTRRVGRNRRPAEPETAASALRSSSSEAARGAPRPGTGTRRRSSPAARIAAGTRRPS